ncbi:hypothetical protein THITH_04335 [Thioalkalivibrio paradoxus ARh 1]|uniref:Uncharacterized protein n=1 Tax=Thioalkalivibrio paradoxus ARh 1 TaxID=713585 RepID=W0DSH2_9GAMM|nr:hypothetical protein THITH_04335 [Thioalkalivibrio paradoxus ARh 1]
MRALLEGLLVWILRDPEKFRFGGCRRESQSDGCTGARAAPARGWK